MSLTHCSPSRAEIHRPSIMRPNCLTFHICGVIAAAVFSVMAAAHEAVFKVIIATFQVILLRLGARPHCAQCILYSSMFVVAHVFFNQHRASHAGAPDYKALVALFLYFCSGELLAHVELSCLLVVTADARWSVAEAQRTNTSGSFPTYTIV